jgi:hypothetical protein
VTDLVPASALSAEMAGHVDTYFGVNYAASGTPAAPATLQLGAGSPTVSAPQQVSADDFQYTLTFSCRRTARTTQPPGTTAR